MTLKRLIKFMKKAKKAGMSLEELEKYRIAAHMIYAKPKDKK
jgi:hypothetical protein